MNMDIPFIWDDDKVAEYLKNPISINVFKKNWLTENVAQINYDMTDVLSFLDLYGDVNASQLFRKGMSDYYAYDGSEKAYSRKFLLSNDRFLIRSVIRKEDGLEFQLGNITEHGTITRFLISKCKIGISFITQYGTQLPITAIKSVSINEY